MHIWIGGLLYVDDLALMSICPRELQSMLHACQHWSIRNRMQINTEKTKIMAFFETLPLLRARGGQRQPSPTMTPFHMYSPFSTSDPRSYPILEVSQFEYLGLILDPKLTMHLATVEAIRRASQGQALALAVSYWLRYDRNSSQLTPTQNLGLWKSIVLPHFLQNLRHIHSDTDIKKMQTSLNLSMARFLHVYGDHTGLLADTGIPPLQLTRYVYLAQLHFRLTITRPDTLPALLFKRLNSSLPLPNLHTSILDYHIRYATHAFKVDLQTGPLPDMTLQPTTNRERAFRNMMRKTIGTLWRGQLYNDARTHALQSPGRKASYIRIAHADLQCLDLFKPAQFLRIHHN